MFKGKFRQVIKIIRPHYVFVLFGFVEVKKFRDSVKFRIEFIMVEKSSQKNWHSAKRPHYVFALFDFVEVKKFTDSGVISD